MFRLLGVGAVLLGVTSAGVAGEHYVEIWNPPEARMLPSSSTTNTVTSTAAPSGKPKHNKAALLSRLSARPASRTAGTRKVADAMADPAAKASSSHTHHADEGPRRLSTPRAADLPRIVTPEGNVLRVHDQGAVVRVVR